MSMENTSTQQPYNDYLEQRKKHDARIIAVIATVVLLGFFALLAYMFFGY